MPHHLDPYASFQAGFWDGLQNRDNKPTEFGYVESDFGSVPPHNFKHYMQGWEYGKRLRQL